MGNSGKTDKPGKSQSNKVITSYGGTVLWESAKPVGDALKLPLLEDFAGFTARAARRRPPPGHIPRKPTTVTSSLREPALKSATSSTIA